MASPLPTATWPSISGLETSNYPVPIEAAPTAAACLFLATTLCLGFILQPSKLKPIFRRDEEDCLESEAGAGVDSASKTSRPAPLPLQSCSAHQVLPTLIPSVNQLFPSSSKGPKLSQAVRDNGRANDAIHMSMSNAPTTCSPPTTSRNLHKLTVTGPKLFISESVPLQPRQATTGDDHLYLQPNTGYTDRYLSATTSMISGTTGFGGTDASRRQGLDIGSIYEGSFVPSVLRDKRVSQDPY